MVSFMKSRKETTPRALKVPKIKKEPAADQPIIDGVISAMTRVNNQLVVTAAE